MSCLTHSETTTEAVQAAWSKGEGDVYGRAVVAGDTGMTWIGWGSTGGGELVLH